MTESSQSAVKAEDPIPVILGHAMLNCCYCRETHSPWVWGRQQPVLFCFAQFNLGYPPNTMTGKSSPFAEGTFFSEKKTTCSNKPFSPTFFSYHDYRIFDSVNYFIWVTIMNTQQQQQKSMSDSEAKLIMSGMLCCFCKALTGQHSVPPIHIHKKALSKTCKHFPCSVCATKAHPNKSTEVESRREIVSISPCTLNKCLALWPQNHPSALQWSLSRS